MKRVETLEQIQQRAADHIVELMYQDPEMAKFGIMISENIGMPSDQITMLWLFNVEQLAKFIELSLPFSYCSIESYEEMPEEFSKISREIENLDKPLLQQEQIDLLNSFMSLSSIQWTGTFNDLCAAKGEAEKMLIKWLRQNGSDSPIINDNERGNFKDFLMNNVNQ